MKNREQIAWSISFSEYSDREVAEQIADMVETACGEIIFGSELDLLEKWLGLECNKGNN